MFENRYCFGLWFINRFFVLLLIGIVISKPLNAQNLALNKNYILSASPNYPHSAPASDKVSLTDGVYTKDKYFWNKPTTLGWQSKEVAITIDLGNIAPISDVIIHTFRSVNSDIYFPQNLFVFISDDNKKYKYLGDVGDVLDNQPGALQFKKFSLNHINEFARYVVVVFIPHGYFIFCDEIEVLQGKGKNSIGVQSILKDSLMQFVDSLKTPLLSKRILSAINNKLRFSENRQQAIEIDSELKSNNSFQGLENIDRKIGMRHAHYLNDLFNAPYIVEKYNPWDSLTRYRIPARNEGVLNYQFLIQKGNVQLGAFLITNAKPTVEKFSFHYLNSPKTNIELYSVPFVPVSYFHAIPDPLIHAKSGVTIGPGATSMFIFKIDGIKNGNDSSTITISSPDRIVKINLDVIVLDMIGQKSITNLNANVWAYFNHPMIKNVKSEAGRDLQLHQINTFVIPPTRLPSFETNSYQPFINYLNNFPKAKNILLYLDYSDKVRRNGYAKGRYMSENWKKRFTNWYCRVKKLIQENQKYPINIYLYPYDEIRPEDINDFQKLILWSKKAIPGIQFYATLGNRKAVEGILPLVDIAQIHSSYEGIKNLSNRDTEIWIYNGVTPSRGLPPYGFYRLMSWNAFVNDYSGIGFWNYADEQNGGKLNLISGGSFNPVGSYSVIYNNPDGGIISSRRWEAFRLGLEDYSILQIYSEKFGIDKSKALSKQVIQQPDNLNLADSIRENMINAITGKFKK